MANIYSLKWEDYELIDSGNGKKLERFGSVTLIRPELSATHKPSLNIEDWIKKSDAEFIESASLKGEWKRYKEIPDKWVISYQNISGFKLNLKLTPFKHIGVFPEQSVNWDRLIKNKKNRVLNLFAYTGAASIAAASSDKDITHVDSVNGVVEWAKKNAITSNLDNIRWICEDAVRFTERESKRESRYDTIILDPPTWGFNKQKKGWKIERDLPMLISSLEKILNKNGEIILNCYSIRIEKPRLEKILKSNGSYLKWNIQDLKNRDSFGKEISCGFLAIGQ